MKMKSLSVISATFIFAMFFVLPCKAQTPSKVMPVTTSSKDALKAFTKGRVEFENSQTTKAAVMFKKAIDLDPDFALANLYLSLSDGSFYPEKFDKAINLKDKVSNGERIFLEMLDNQRKGNGSEMEKNCRALAELYPGDPRTQYILGSYIYYGDDEKAIFYLKKAIELDKNFAPAYADLGSKYESLRNFEEAEKNYLKYAEILPDYPKSLQQLGTLYRDEGNFDKALEFYFKMLKQDSSMITYLMIGNCYIFKDDFVKAREYFMKGYERAVNEDEKLAALSNNAISFIFEGNMDGALKAFDNIRDLAEKGKRYGTIIDSYLNQVFVSLIFNDNTKAKMYLDKAEEEIKTSAINDIDGIAYKESIPIWRSFYLTSAGDYVAAEKEAESYKAIVEQGKMPSAMQSVALIFGFLRLRQQRYDEAIEYLLKGGNYYNTWYYLGEAYEGKGETVKAKEYFTKVASANLCDINLASVRSLAIEKLKKGSATNLK
jgi:tetratricopeptide (TPR) repeat protein